MRELKKKPSNPAFWEQRVKRREVRVRPISGESDNDGVRSGEIIGRLSESWNAELTHPPV